MLKALCRQGVELLWAAYAAGLATFLIFSPADPGGRPWMTLLNIFLPFLFLPAVAAGVWVGWELRFRRSRRSYGKWMAAALLLVPILLYGPYFRPKGAAPGAGALKVMTFNLGPGQADPERLAAAILAEDPDWVALQELTAPVADVLRRRLEARYPYWAIDPAMEGPALVSRYPIRTPEWIQPGGAGRRALRARIDWEGRSIQVLALHPDPAGLRWGRVPGLPGGGVPVGVDDSLPQQQVAAAAGLMALQEGPRIVLGDFNLSERSAAYGALAAELGDVYREAGTGFGFTFPVGLNVGGVPLPGPLVRLDYLFHSADFRARRAAVGCRSSSDHCYLVAWLEAGE